MTSVSVAGSNPDVGSSSIKTCGFRSNSRAIPKRFCCPPLNAPTRLLSSFSRPTIFKTDASWAIDLDSILEGYSGEDGCIHQQVDTGRTYGDYLRILLYVKDDNILTARILDLIQINMRKNYDEKFLVQECATGVSVDADIYGRKLSYDRIY